MKIELAFTTRIPLAVMIILGIKRWENRSSMPVPSIGVCAMTCSKTSDEREYRNFLTWANRFLSQEIFSAIPQWETISPWRGKLVAVCDYKASYKPGLSCWDDGYPIWWELSNVQLLEEPFSCRGNVGMWRLSNELSLYLNEQKLINIQ